MNIVSCVQGSPEWMDARRGRVTASRFCDIITPMGKPVTGKSRRAYVLELVAERLTGITERHYVTSAMERGTELESRARAWYELKTGKVVEQVGFVLAENERWGCSPDGLFVDGGLEIKCPHRIALLDMIESRVPSPDYMLQMQACMWICQRRQWDFVVWTDDPNLPCATWPVERAAPLHEAFEEIIPAFCNEVDKAEAKLRELMK